MIAFRVAFGHLWCSGCCQIAPATRIFLDIRRRPQVRSKQAAEAPAAAQKGRDLETADRELNAAKAKLEVTSEELQRKRDLVTAGAQRRGSSALS